MKPIKPAYAALAALFLSGTLYAGNTDRALAQRIHTAVAPVAKKMKLVRDTGFNARQSEGVPYASEAGCDGASYCTVLVVYYDRQPNCQRQPGWRAGFTRGTEKMRDIYNLKHKNVCYQISVNGKRNAEAVAAAIWAKM